MSYPHLAKEEMPALAAVLQGDYHLDDNPDGIFTVQ